MALSKEIYFPAVEKLLASSTISAVPRASNPYQPSQDFERGAWRALGVCLLAPRRYAPLPVWWTPS